MRFHVAAAQLKPKKADVAANLARIGELFSQVDDLSPRPDLLVLPETALTGYFLEGGVRDVAIDRETLFQDLLALYRKSTRSDAPPLDVVVGFYERWKGAAYNAALYATLSHSDSPWEPEIQHVHHKFFLPTYGVFDEKRFVARGRRIDAFNTRLGRMSILICEDVWHSVSPTLAALQGAETLIIISASPGRDFTGARAGNLDRWQRLLPSIADEHNIFVVYSGLVGFEGGKGFTGSSSVVDPWGTVLVQAPVLDECLVTATIDLDEIAAARSASPLLADLQAVIPDVAFQFEEVSRGERNP